MVSNNNNFLNNIKNHYRLYISVCLDFGAYLIPVITSLYWIRSIDKGSIENTQAISISCLLLDIKLLLFFRAFESFGIYFAIMLGVAKRIISFLFIILIIIFSFAHAFLILLRHENTDSFSDYPSSLLTTYLILTGTIYCMNDFIYYLFFSLTFNNIHYNFNRKWNHFNHK